MVTAVEDSFGSLPEGTEVHRFTLSNNVLSVQIINFGATITSIKFPDSKGNPLDLVLGFDQIEGYLGKSNRYFGATVGRCANRIAKGQFTLDGKVYNLSINNGPNHLHGGNQGFDKKVWKGTINGNQVTFKYTSPDGEEGYPGEVSVIVTFELTTDNELIISYEAKSDKPTPINLTNHSYFNLGGHEKANDTLKNHFIRINAEHYTPTDENLIPTGEIRAVEGSIYDFRKETDIAKVLKTFPEEGNYGFDSNFCLIPSKDKSVSLASRVHNVESGIVLEVHTDLPGIQFYTSNFLPDERRGEEAFKGKNGTSYWKHGAFCLETQNYPNAINIDSFPNCVLLPGEAYRTKTIYTFLHLPKTTN